MKTFFLIILISVFQPKEESKKDSLKTVDIISHNLKTEKDLFSDNTFYQMLYESEKENNQQLLSTLYWTFGTSITFLLAIFGGQIFFNWRVNKKEIEYINKDIEEKFGKLRADLLSTISDINKENLAHINSILEKLEKETKSRIEELFEEKSKLFNAKEENLKLKIDTLKKENERSIKRLNIAVEKNQGDLWILKGVESNALLRYVNCAILNIEIDYDVEYILKEITQLLNKLEEINILDKNGLDKLVELVKAYNQQEAEQIKELYKNKPVYYFSNEKNVLGLLKKIYIKN